MCLILSSLLDIPSHFYPLNKGWVSGPNLLLDTLVPITPVGSVEGWRPTKSEFLLFSFSYVCQSVRPYVLYFSLVCHPSVCTCTFDFSHPSWWDLVSLLSFSIQRNNQLKWTYAPRYSPHYRFNHDKKHLSRVFPKTQK